MVAAERPALRIFSLSLKFLQITSFSSYEFHSHSTTKTNFMQMNLRPAPSVL